MKLSFRDRFLRFINNEQLFDGESKILLTLSGGVDSVVMAHLFHEAGFNFGIAHCNFGLRGKESDEDEALVKELAAKYRVPFYSKRFDTLEYAEKNSLSIQMAARELRYTWFEEIRQENGYTFIATAHHKNDSAETILLNLSKGAILKGIQGIPSKNGYIIRPMLWAEKEKIINYSEKNKLGYREDASNAEDKYQRNLIRNKIIPLLQEINPSAIQSITDAAKPRKLIEKWFEQHIIDVKSSSFSNNSFSIPKLKEAGADVAILYYLLEPYGLNYTQAEELYNSLDATEPKNFYTQLLRIVKDRDSIRILPLEDEPKDEICTISKIPATVTFNGFKFTFEWTDIEDVHDLKNPNKAFLDLAKISFPIQIRKWQAGDFFYPLGLGKKKNISDFLTDIKIPAVEKENQPVILSKNNIISVAGRRPDDRFKVTNNTTQAMRILMERI